MENDVTETNEKGVPGFLYNAEETGMEDVENNIGFQELRVCTKMSKVFEDGEVELGHIYNRETAEDLDEYLDLIIFKYRVTHQLFNEDNDGILCKSYDKSTGNVRVYNDSFDPEAIEKLEITNEDIKDEETRIVTRSCDDCPFHPRDGWKTDPDSGKRIPPRCKESHELYTLNVTPGPHNFEKAPYLIRINNTSRPKQELIEDIKNLINNKLRLEKLPIFAGVFKFGSHQRENSRGKKNYIWDISWRGLIPGNDAGKELFKFAENMLVEFNKREDEMNKEAEKRLAQEAEEDVIDANVEEQEGDPFGDDEGEEEGDFDDPPWDE